MTDTKCYNTSYTCSAGHVNETWSMIIDKPNGLFDVGGGSTWDFCNSDEADGYCYAKPTDKDRARMSADVRTQHERFLLAMREADEIDIDDLEAAGDWADLFDQIYGCSKCGKHALVTTCLCTCHE